MTHPAHTDFLAFAAGARILSSGSTCLYCPDSWARVQTDLLGAAPDNGVVPYANPPAAAWLLQPIAGLPLSVGLALFVAASLGALVAAGALLVRLLPSIWPAQRRLLIVVILVGLVPGAGALAYGQWTPLLLLPAAAAVVLVAQRGDAFVAGVLLSAVLVKPQLVWLAPILLVAAGAWRTLGGLAAGGLGWVVSGLLIVGPTGFADWVGAVLPAHVGEATKGAGLPAAVAALSGSDHAAFATAAGLALLIAALALRWRAGLRANLAETIGLGLAVSALCSPHVYGGDLLLVAPLLVIWAAAQPGGAIAASVALAVASTLDQQLPTGAAHFQSAAMAGVLTAYLLSRGLSEGRRQLPAWQSLPRSLRRA